MQSALPLVASAANASFRNARKSLPCPPANRIDCSPEKVVFVNHFVAGPGLLGTVLVERSRPFRVPVVAKHMFQLCRGHQG